MDFFPRVSQGNPYYKYDLVSLDQCHLRDQWLVSLFNGISSFVSYLMPKLSFLKNSCGIIQSIARRIRGEPYLSQESQRIRVEPYLSQKVNVLAQLEFELAYYVSAMQRF